MHMKHYYFIKINLYFKAERISTINLQICLMRLCDFVEMNSGRFDMFIIFYQVLFNQEWRQILNLHQHLNWNVFDITVKGLRVLGIGNQNNKSV